MIKELKPWQNTNFIIQNNRRLRVRVRVRFVLFCSHPLSTYAIFSEKLTFLTPWYANVRVRVRGLERLVFRKILRTYLMDDPFILNSLPLTRDVKCSILYLEGKDRRKCQMNNLENLRITASTSRFLLPVNFWNVETA